MLRPSRSHLFTLLSTLLRQLRKNGERSMLLLEESNFRGDLLIVELYLYVKATEEHLKCKRQEGPGNEVLS